MRAPALPLLLVLACAMLALAGAAAFLEDAGGGPEGDAEADAALQDYADDLQRLLEAPHNSGAPRARLPPPDDARARDKRRRACLRRGSNCDHRPKDCCYNSACRCNLWGANCRCLRMGIFQKWGK